MRQRHAHKCKYSSLARAVPAVENFLWNETKIRFNSRDPDAVTRPENIDSLPPNVHCARIRSLQKLIRYAETRIRYQQELIDIETFDQRDTDATQLQSYIHAKGATELDYNLKLGELKLLFPCPVQNCNHNTTNGLNATRHKKRAAESCILPASFNPYSKETNSTSKKSKTNNKDTCSNTAEISNRKELPENTIPVNNPFSVLTIDDDDMEVAGSVENNDIAQPKVKPIMLKFNKNFNLILQHLNRKYPDSVNKLTDEYIKITAANIDQHGEITKELKEKGEEFYAVPNPGDRPLKMVLKGLPSNTDIDDIKYDLANQGLPVMKVAQLTQRKLKFPLPRRS
ncbi:nucleic-acid-binding protein from transposon X-element [Trichonephila clavipes]|nr:nucleic-acid-binding protein from transposon X-element [Trichonephila clavipes]